MFIEDADAVMPGQVRDAPVVSRGRRPLLSRFKLDLQNSPVLVYEPYLTRDTSSSKVTVSNEPEANESVAVERQAKEPKKRLVTKHAFGVDEDTEQSDIAYSSAEEDDMRSRPQSSTSRKIKVISSSIHDEHPNLSLFQATQYVTPLEDIINTQEQVVTPSKRRIISKAQSEDRALSVSPPLKAKKVAKQEEDDPISKNSASPFDKSLRSGEVACRQVPAGMRFDKFLRTALPHNMLAFCRVQPQKTSYAHGVLLRMDNDDVRNPVILCSRREIKLNGTLKVVVAQQSEDTSSKATRMAVIRGNLSGSKYSVYDGAGLKGGRILAQIWYPKRRFTDGPKQGNGVGRTMIVRIPKDSLKLKQKKEKLFSSTDDDDEEEGDGIDEDALDEWTTFVNVQPEIVGTEKRMPFFGRATEASIKNFQLIKRSDRDEESPRIALLFGKCSDDSFSLDYRSPLTALTSLCIAITACENPVMSRS